MRHGTSLLQIMILYKKYPCPLFLRLAPFVGRFEQKTSATMSENNFAAKKFQFSDKLVTNYLQ